MFRVRPASRALPVANPPIKYPPKAATDQEVMEWLDKHSVEETAGPSKVAKVGYSLGPKIVVAKEDKKPTQENTDSVVWDDFTDEDVLWNCADQADALLVAQQPRDDSEKEKEAGLKTGLKTGLEADLTAVLEAAGGQFRTARGSAISVSKESLERAQKLWLEETETE